MLTSPFIVWGNEQVALFGFCGVAYWQACQTQTNSLFVFSYISFSICSFFIIQVPYVVVIPIHCVPKVQKKSRVFKSFDIWRLLSLSFLSALTDVEKAAGHHSHPLIQELALQDLLVKIVLIIAHNGEGFNV
jgi:hypothetical protein